MRELPVWSGLLPLTLLVILLGAAMLVGLDLWTVWIVRNETTRSLAAALRAAEADAYAEPRLEARVARELRAMGFRIGDGDLALRQPDPGGTGPEIRWTLDVPLQMGFLPSPRLEVRATTKAGTLARTGRRPGRWMVHRWIPGPGAEALVAALEARRTRGEPVLAVLGEGPGGAWVLVELPAGAEPLFDPATELAGPDGAEAWDRLVRLPGLGSPRTLRVLSVPAEP
jgi:hypothetical protein